MPRNVRNYWVSLEVGGRKTRVAAGPRGKEQGFTCTVWMRNDGSVDPKPLVVAGLVVDGLLQLRVYRNRNELVYSRTTKR